MTLLFALNAHVQQAAAGLRKEVSYSVQAGDFDARLARVLAQQFLPSRVVAESCVRAPGPVSKAERRSSSQPGFRAVLTGLFRVLRSDLGLDLDDPVQLDRRHVQALLDYMEARWMEGALDVWTIRGYCRVLNQYAALIRRLDVLRGVGFKEAGLRQQLGERQTSAESRAAATEVPA